MAEEFIVLGELHQDLYYESEFYDNLVEKITTKLLNFIHHNPDDFNSRIARKIIAQAFGEIPKKIESQGYIKRGGNGNNSADYVSRLEIPTRLISVIGRDCEWMISELKENGINTDYIFQQDALTPISTVIKSKFTTKIHVAPNLKQKMNFEAIDITKEAFENAKIIFTTPISSKFKSLFEMGESLGLITAFTIEAQKIHSLEQLSNIIGETKDIFFLNLKDAKLILKEDLNLDKIDEKLSRFAKVRVYTAGEKGSYLLTDNFQIHHPSIKVKEIIDLTGAGDSYAAGFLSKIYELIEDKYHFQEYTKIERIKEFEYILKESMKFGTISSLYKITKQVAPSKAELDDFIKQLEK
ncbi:MAG: carbohydrate kinase family protein [Candidatus Lokiarchaeota archaeon]|nr:carbohydrate kinase family protein [Candidatus Lokiarchaeota archaeon]